MRQNLIIIFFFLIVYGNAQTRYKSFHFTTDDGLPSNIIYSIAEDKNKNLIIGTDNGFSVFNGNSFKNFNIKQGLDNPYIVSVFNENNKIWLLNYNGKLQKFQDGKIVSTPIFSEYQNHIITTKNTIYLYSLQNRNANKTYSYISINKANYTVTTPKINTIFQRSAPPLLMQSNFEIKIINNFLEYKNLKIKLPEEIKFIHKVVFRKQDICVLEDNFLFLINYQGQILSKIKLPSNLSVNPIYKHDFVVDKFQNCWLSIQNKGLFILRNASWIALSESIGFTNQDNINFLYPDFYGKMWIATNEKGLFCIPSTLNEIITFKNSDNYFNGFATAIDEKSLFIATRFGLYSCNKINNIAEVMQFQAGIKIDNFDKIPILYTLYTKPNFWTTAVNIFKINGKQLVEKNEKSSIFLTGNNSITISKSVNNVVLEKKLDNKIPKKEKIKSVLKFKNEYYFNNGQEIDIRTFDSTYIYKKRNLKFKINGFIEDFNFINDTLWIAANNAVYKVFNEKIIDSIVAVNDVKLNNVRKIKQLGSDVFLCAGNGLFKIGKNGNLVFNKFNFLPTNEVYNAAFFNKKLFIATNNGLVKIDEELCKKTQKPSLEVFFKQTRIEKILLPANQESVSINLQIQNFYALQNQIIQYKVDQSKWLFASSKTIDFELIAYGNHQVTVRVKDVNSDWESKKFQISRAYPFYLKWWFLLFGFLLLFALFGLLYQNQIKKINQKKLQEIATNNQIIELRQNALSAMMNPHFIFNSLNAGQYFINSNQQEKSSDHIGKLARLVRLFLSQSSQSFISIADEIKRLKLYVELEQVRFNSFEFELNIDPKIDVAFIKIPNMIVQPFLENAILHGISSPKIIDGKIELNIMQIDTKITIEIIDNGFGIDKNKLKNDNHISKGIAIIEERLAILQQSNPTKIFSISQCFAFLNLQRKGHKVVIIISILD